jgi:hypothetical protein
MARWVSPRNIWAKMRATGRPAGNRPSGEPREGRERLPTETDLVLGDNLETVLAHVRAEAEGNLDGVLATLARRRAAHLLEPGGARGPS